MDRSMWARATSEGRSSQARPERGGGLSPRPFLDGPPFRPSEESERSRLSFAAGFTGSSGTAVITADAALVWTDGRYFAQVSPHLRGSLPAIFSFLTGFHPPTSPRCETALTGDHPLPPPPTCLQALVELQEPWKLMRDVRHATGRSGEDPPMHRWLADNLARGSAVGVDPWLVSVDTCRRWAVRSHATGTARILGGGGAAM